MEEKSIAQMKKELNEFYFKEVKDNIDEINRIRKLEKCNTFCALGMLIGLSGLVISAFFNLNTLVIFNLGLIVLSVLLMMLNNMHNKSKTINIDASGEAVIKKRLMNNFLKIFGDFQWSKGGGSKVDIEYIRTLQKLNIINYTIIGNIDDHIEGIYKDVNFRIFEYDSSLSLQNLIGYLALAPFLVGCGCSVGLCVLGILVMIAGLLNFFWLLLIIPIALLIAFIRLIILLCTYVPFRGVFVEFDMNKNFEGHTFLFENALTNRGIKYEHSAFQDVILEDVEFNKKYKIFSDNQIEARVVLTPAFIERFKNMKTAFKAKYIRAAFKDKKITIAVNAGKDLFAMANLTKDTSAETFVELFNEILSVLQMIDALKLNQRTGL